MDVTEKIKRYIRTINWATVSSGKHALGGKDYVNITSFETHGRKELAFEKHERYADGFYVLEGEEKVLLSKHSNGILQSYSAQNDVAFHRCFLYDTKVIKKGDLLVIDTDTYHVASLPVMAPSFVKVAIFKISKQ